MDRQKYFTNLASPIDSRYPDLPYKGRGWYVSFDSNLVLQDGFIYYYTNKGKPTPPKYIIIHATNEEVAQNAVDLIFAASCLVNEDCSHALMLNAKNVFLLNKNHAKPKDIFNIDTQPIVNEYQFPCLIAARASYRKSLQYALMKYQLSQQSFSTYVDELDPSHWSPQKFVYNSVLHHARCAQAIMLGYSVIEELGLEIRADQKRPSFINNEWNPLIKEELEQRLVKSGIDLSERAHWVMRDTPTKIERKKAIRAVTKAPWAYAKVRDSEVEVIDAIALASWMRSKASAHRLNKISSSLSYYDVSNLHYLSRRLLLERLGLWHYHEFKKKK
jgi:hypothetical protein